MRYREIQRRPAAPDTHPFVADIAIDPAEFSTFERLMQDRPGVTLLCRIDRSDTSVVHVACASEMTCRHLLDAWG